MGEDRDIVEQVQNQARKGEQAPPPRPASDRDAEETDVDTDTELDAG